MPININPTFKEIWEILKPDVSPPCHFHPLETLNKQNYVSCQFLGIAEFNALRNGSHSNTTEYDQSDVGVHFPDTDIATFLHLEQNRNPINIDQVMDDISNLFLIYQVEYAVVFSIYCILHEIGHWKHFVDSGKQAYEYYLEDLNNRKDLLRIRQFIYDLPNDSPLKKVLSIDYNKQYRNIPSEYAADQFAFSHILPSIDKVRNALGYTEDDLLHIFD